jgi:hypothetical protein
MKITGLVPLAILLSGCTSTHPAVDSSSPPADLAVPADSADQAASDAASPVAYPACHWPASLDPTDAGDSRCQAKRYRLQCDGGDAGVRAFCISNDPTQCEGLSTSVPGATFTCHHDCAPNEFGLVCGRIGPASAPPAEPPAGCHSFSGTPAGIVFYCCPCS